MCSLCGILGVETHWSDAVARPGIYSHNDDPHKRRLERTRRIAMVNRVLAAHALRLSDWHGRAYMLSTATGKTEMIETLSHLWYSAESLSNRTFDPLDPAFLARLSGP